MASLNRKAAVDLAGWAGGGGERSEGEFDGKGSASRVSSPVRRWVFGTGQADRVIYLILEEQQEFHLLLVQWRG